jgi:hypothetical protein
MSLITTEPAPTTTSLPITTPCFTTAFAPIKERSPIFTLPASTAPGAICALSPIVQSCSIIQAVFKMTLFPILAKALIETFLLIKAPFPINADFEIEAD